MPTWVPDLLGMLSGLSMTVPAWRASAILRAVADLRREAANIPPVQSPKFVPHSQVVRDLTEAMLSTAQIWNRKDDFMLKLGVVLLIASFAVKLFL